MSVWAIGDIQGCVNPLQALLKKIEFNADKDQLWIAGDLVNRGPDSLATLRLLYDLRENCTVVLGNHDLHLLAVASGERPIGRKDTFSDVLEAPDQEELLAWLQAQKLLHVDPHRKWIMVHAGIPPNWSLPQSIGYSAEVESVLASKDAGRYFANMYGDDPAVFDSEIDRFSRLRQITNYLTRMRFCDINGVLDLKDKSNTVSEKPGFKPWFEWLEDRTEGHEIVFGHWAALEGVTNNVAVHALDTGCVWGECLTAFDLDSREKRACHC